MKDPKITRQENLEGLMKGLGEKAYRDQVIQAKEKGIESKTSYGRFLVKAGISPVSEKIREYYENSLSGRRGRKTTCALLLKQIVEAHNGDVQKSCDTCAFVVLQGIIDHLSSEVKLQAAAISIAYSIEDEARFAAFREQRPPLFDKLNKDLDSRTKSISHKRTTMVRSMNKAGVEWQKWALRDRISLGTVLIELAIDATGLAQIKRIRERKNRTSWFIQPTPETLEWIRKRGEHDAVLSPTYMPCVIPPRDWTTPYDGGYYTEEARVRMSLVKPVKSMPGEVKRNYLEELAARSDEMPAVYESVNAMQRTAWQISPDVYPVFREVWANMGSQGKAGLPAWIDYEPRDVMEPYPENGDHEERMDWRKKASRMWASILRINSQVIQIQRVAFIAQKYAEEEEIFFPYQLDFRGRVYATPGILNPQGSDLSRGLLRFAQGKPLVDETAYRWWCIHGANVWGEDKLPLAERVEWVESNAEMIERVGTDPLANTEWYDADSPWQALAWSMEFARYLQDPEGFVSHLPVQLDGSCNGLQHFSAMLRDETGGEATNLIPSDRPQDIYQRVADRASEKLRLMLSDSGSEVSDEDKEMAQRWLDIGLSRSTTKRSVMIRPYGGTLKATQRYIDEHLFDDRTEAERRHLNPSDPAEMFKASMMLAKVVYEALDEVVVASKEAMDWLQQVSRLASEQQIPVNWQTPAGFYVLQAYPDVKLSRVETVLGDRTMKLSVKTGTNKIDRRKQATGISPNFVHSLDAAALMLYVCKAKARGIEHFSLVHDSYGVHAADTQASVDCLREAFVEMYEQHDPLREFRDQVAEPLTDKRRDRIPPLPEKGSLEIRRVLDSQYFFA